MLLFETKIGCPVFRHHNGSTVVIRDKKLLVVVFRDKKLLAVVIRDISIFLDADFLLASLDFTL